MDRATEARDMPEREFKRIIRPATADERQRHAAIREQIQQEFPPTDGASRAASPPGIPAQIRQSRESKGLSWHALAQLAGLPDSNTIRDIEYGRDVSLKDVQAVAKALGLRVELAQEKELER
jgi:hypothetical protein